MAKQTFSTGQVLTAAQMTSLQQTAMLGGAASAKTASYTLVAADAGTAISMSSASATTITVNTALFAAGDTVQITNLGAGVCTITAGTATVNTSASLALAQYESGTLDFTSSSAAIFIKGAGATSSGGFTSLASGTLSGTTVTISGISSSYINMYLFIIGAKAATSGGLLIVRLNNVATAANSKWSWMNTDGNAVNANSGSAFVFNNLDVLTTTNSSQAQMEIRNYSATGAKKHVNMYTSPESTYGIFAAGVQNTITDAISQIDIFNDNGVSFTGGTYVLYGVK